jgi:hypothetical protein
VLIDAQGFRNGAESLGVGAAMVFDPSTRRAAITSLEKFASNFATSECYRSHVIRGIGNNIADTFNDSQKLSQAIANISAGTVLSLVVGGAEVADAADVANAAESDTALLQAHVEDTIARLDAEGLAFAQERALVNNPNLQSAFEGERIDAFFRESVADDQALQHLELTPRGQFGPDVFNPETQEWWDVTTPRQWDAHAQEYWLFGNGTPLFH